MTVADGQTVAAWRYPGDYSFYDADADAEDLAELLNPAEWGHRYFAADEEARHELAGFVVVKLSGRVAEIGLGLQPGFQKVERYEHFTNGGLHAFVRMARARSTVRTDSAKRSSRRLAGQRNISASKPRSHITSRAVPADTPLRAAGRTGLPPHTCTRSRLTARTGWPVAAERQRDGLHGRALALSFLASSAEARKTLARWADGEAPIDTMPGSVRSAGYLRLCVAS
jgi:hypothetical protein